MSIATRKQVWMKGANLFSGGVNTGEVAWNRGGTVAAHVYSGAITMSGRSSAVSSGGSVLFFSGAGRLNTFTAHPPVGVALAGNGAIGFLSGIPIVVYDAAIMARSGVVTDATLAESGAH